ncbi:MAG: hypothetical protein K0R87_309 [Pseudonocardia sp.]|nr:hypothetical protein [Pseudonocardia sp.]
MTKQPGTGAASPACRRRYSLGGMPTSSVNRALNDPRLAKPTRLTDLGDGEVRVAQQVLRTLDAPAGEVGPRCLAVGLLEPAREVVAREPRGPGHSVQVERFGEVPVDEVARAPKVKDRGDDRSRHGPILAVLPASVAPRCAYRLTHDDSRMRTADSRAQLCRLARHFVATRAPLRNPSRGHRALARAVTGPASQPATSRRVRSRTTGGPSWDASTARTRAAVFGWVRHAHRTM